MSSSAAPLLSPVGMTIGAVYLLLLLAIGGFGRAIRKENSLSDFYLGGRGIGFFVLFLTLYATQYSGNTLIGFAGKAYREGYFFLISVTAMMGVIACYLYFAPKLERLSKKHHFITLSDYIDYRYRSSPLAILVSVIGVVALANYILSNLKAIGHIVEISTGGMVDFATGIFVLSFVMVVYESLGGLRSVAWTDAIQGIMLLIGCAIIFVAIEVQYDGLTGAALKLSQIQPEFWEIPTPTEKRSMLGILLLISFGIPMYPHAVQRFYAAKDSTTLKRSLQLMIFMPLVTTFFMVCVGIVGAAEMPGLSRADSERIAILLLSDIAQHIPLLSVVVVLFLVAAIAAIMSTVDSALLAIASMFTQDFYRRVYPASDEKHLTFLGKIFSWLIMAAMAFLAVSLPQTIWRLIEIKLELLCQVAPAVLLGVNIARIKARAVLSGLLVGCGVTFAVLFANLLGFDVPKKPWGIYGGLWGLAANFAVVFLMTRFSDSDGDSVDKEIYTARQ